MRHPITILIVEDEATIVMLWQMLLEQAGYHVCDAAATGEEAIASVERTQPDIILMDIGLPGGMDGIEAAHQIRSRYDIPVIFSTGYQNEAMVERARQVHPIAYLIKPVSINQLRAAIDSVFA